MTTTDFAVVGGGVVGLTIALEIKRRHPDASVRLLEKEPRCGEHASGRNSGVLHAGFYYDADSLKARFTREGNRRLKQFCDEHGLAVNRCGKLVVARDEDDLAGLDELKRRGAVNGVLLEEVSEADAREIEPRVKTRGRALWSPDTATVDASAVVAELAGEAQRAGIALMTGVRYLGRKSDLLLTSDGDTQAGYTVNAAGLYADRVARDFGFGRRHRIVPFKGLYVHSDEPPWSLATCVYPVPNLGNPFLGVHITVAHDGHSKVGPTAIPCLWREQYRWAGGFSMADACEVTASLAGLVRAGGTGFARLAAGEARKYWRPVLVRQASELVSGLDPSKLRRWGRPGIRAQLMRTSDRALEMDFVLEGDERSMHVLNAVSPAFTCCLPFAEYVAGEIERTAG